MGHLQLLLMSMNQSTGTHWIAFHVNSDNVKYFDSFRVEHIPKEIKRFISNDIFRIQTYDLIMYGYFCIGFTDFTL